MTISYNPNFGYEPYWADGEWHVRDPDDWSTTVAGVVLTKAPMVCGDECPYMFKGIKEVCARLDSHDDYLKFDDCFDSYCGPKENMKYPTMDLYRTFNSYCEYLDHQCKNDAHFHFMYVGACEKDFTKIFLPMAHYNQLQTRLDGYLQHLQMSTTLRFSQHQTFPTTPKAQNG